MNVRRAGSIALAAVVVAAASACGSSGGTTTVTESRRAAAKAGSKVLVGAGSTFVAPLVAQWEADYVKSPAAVTITYGAIGSGGGVDQITARTVDFGASDAPLSSDQATACKGCIQIPWSLGRGRDHLQRQGPPEQDPSDRPGHRRDLHGQDHVLERPGDRQAEPGRQPPGHAHHAGLSERWFRNELRLHRLADEGQPRLGEQRRHLDAAALPDRYGRRALERRRGGGPGDRRCADVRRPGIRAGERSAVCAAPERRRQVSGAGRPVGDGGREGGDDESRRIDLAR